jgi:hypothetical protein
MAPEHVPPWATAVCLGKVVVYLLRCFGGIFHVWMCDASVLIYCEGVVCVPGNCISCIAGECAERARERGCVCA